MSEPAGYPKPNFIRFDLGPTLELPVEADAAEGDSSWRRMSFVTLERTRALVAHGHRASVELQLPDRRHRGLLDGVLQTGRPIVSRLTLAPHPTKPALLSGRLLVTTPSRELPCHGPLVLAVSDAALGAWRGGLATLGRPELARRLELVRPRDRVPYAVVRTPILVEQESEADEVHVLVADGWVLVGKVVRDATRACVEIVTAERAGPSAHEGDYSFVSGLLRLEGGLEVVGDDTHLRMSAADLGTLARERNDILDAWLRYHQLEGEHEANQVAQRRQPLRFVEARADGGRWQLHLRTGSALGAWVDDDEKTRSRLRLRQTVKIARAADEIETTDLEGEVAELRELDVAAGVAVAIVTLSKRSAGRVLPTEGFLQAVANRGRSRQEERRLEAASRLVRGQCPNPRVLEWLVAPHDIAAKRHGRGFVAELPLNDAQRRAVEAVLTTEDLVLVQGPPGTGKTQVIVEVLVQLARRCRAERRPLRVLISAVQNDAVANAVARLRGIDVGEGISIHHIEKLDAEDEDGRAGQAVLEQCARLRAGTADDPDVRRDVELQRVDRELGDLEHALLRAAREEDWGPAFRSLEEILDREGVLPEVLRHRGREAMEGARTRIAGSDVPGGVRQSAPSPAPLAGLFDEDPSAAALERLDALWRGSGEEAPAEVGVIVAKILARAREAGSTPDDTIRRVARLWIHARGLLRPADAAPAPLTHREPASAAYVEPLAWIGTCREWIADYRERLRRSPALVRSRLAEALENRPAQWERIQERYSGVVGVTCQRAGDLASSMEDEPFDLAIIDEAGRAAPFDLLIPMTRARRVLLIGDQEQLPPTVEQVLLERMAQERDLDVDLARDTLFSRLFEEVTYANKVGLIQQYRMHEVIGDLVSDCFYKGTLQSYFSGERARERLSSLGLFHDAPLVWVDTAAEIGTRDCYETNEVEARVVGQILRRLEEARSSGALGDGTSCGIITFYREQLTLIHRELERFPLLKDRVETGTVDSFQGKEFPIVVLSTVRHSRAGHMGFLALPNRVNVAFSRAQRQLVVLGSERSARMCEHGHRGSKYLREAANVAREKGLYVDAAEILHGRP